MILATPISVLRAMASVAKRRWIESRLKSARSNLGIVRPTPPAIAGHYLVSGNKGIFSVGPEGIAQVSKLGAFGIALTADTLYAAGVEGDDSVVFAGDAKALQGSHRPFAWRSVYRVSNAGHSGRIHQIAVAGDSLWIANTAKNSYVKVNRHTGEWQGAFAPFRCSFGFPILNDHNHVNAVFPTKNYLLFGAFRINRQSAFGLCGKGKVFLYGYRNMGIHDCIVSGYDLWFSDSYRYFDGTPGGVPCLNGQAIDSDYFTAHPAHFVRGIAGYGNEVLVGNSVVAERANRFEGDGELILLSDRKVVSRFAIPTAQVCDIIRADGRHFERDPEPATFEDAAALLNSVFGEPVEQLDLLDVAVGARGTKTFAAVDVGDLKEYM
ncbi:MAG: hypothetical protein U1A72_14185 [Sulfuritalea sp.]|nr:hypothetical protein [Sulfuritalea sp.]